ncbi:MAG: RNA methyltransferase [Cyclobacteriaceae bacterium]
MVSKNELKFIKSLKVKKYRVREKRFVVEGAKNVQELMNSNYEIDLILSSQHFYDVNRSKTREFRIEIVGDKVLNEAGSFKSNNSCIAVVRSRDFNVDEIDLSALTFVLDGVSDPGNLGTIIRTLDWFGFNQLVCSEDSAELYNPKVVNSSMGSFSRVNTFHLPLKQFFDLNKLPVYGMDMNGKNLFDVAIQSPSVIVLGSESHGISPDVRKRIDYTVTIPKKGAAESLNVGIATGIVAAHLRIP